MASAASLHTRQNWKTAQRHDTGTEDPAGLSNETNQQQAGAPHVAPTNPAQAAPNARAPVLSVKNTAETRPSM